MKDQQTGAPGAPSMIDGLPNLRDLGGWVGRDGRTVRYGMLYRSTDFRSLLGDPDAVAALGRDLGLASVYDLRTTAETEAMPDPSWDGVERIHLDVLGDSKTALPADLGAIFADPAAAAQISEFLAGGGAAEAMTGTYRDLVTLHSARRSYSRFFSGLLGRDRTPILFHCTTGKDRTGWAAAAFLTLMGVARADVFADYLLTNERLLPALTPVFEKFAAAGGDPDLLTGVLGVRRAYLEAAFDEVESVHGGIDAYFADGLGIDADAQESLRTVFLQV